MNRESVGGIVDSGAGPTAGPVIGPVIGPVTVDIANKRGLHARASARFVTLASSFDAVVTVSRDGARVTGTSIMSLLMLAAACGDKIAISATGRQAEDAVRALVDLVEGKFGED